MLMEVKNYQSGVSLAITKTMSSCQNHLPLIEKEKKRSFTVRIANTLEEREEVFKLGYQIYLEKGYIRENANQWLVQNYDFDPETVIIIVQDQDKKIAGSVTLVFDGCSKLPVESIYEDELKALRASGSKMVELSRLIISPEYRNAKEVLVLLYNYLAIYTHHIANFNAFIVEANPRHKNFYKALLGFEEVGQEKPCPHVQSAPAILLHLPTSFYQSEIHRCHGAMQSNSKERSLYPYFIKPEQENLVAYYLAKQRKAMPDNEKNYFGFAESGFHKVVCV